MPRRKQDYSLSNPKRKRVSFEMHEDLKATINREVLNGKAKSRSDLVTRAICNFLNLDYEVFKTCPKKPA